MSCPSSCERTNTSLRQGAILPNDKIALLTLDNYDPNGCYIIISHDCDLMAAIDKEALIEVIQCTFVEPDSNLIYGANVRCLHLPITYQDQSTYIELQPKNKIFLQKSDVIDWLPDSKFNIDPKNLKMLQAWLASRYRRHAFPENLASRLAKVENTIKELGKRAAISKEIISVFIEVDPPNVDLEDDDPYDLKIYVVYDSEASAGHSNAEIMARKIEASIQAAKDKGVAIDAQIFVRADTEFTVKDIRNSSEWRFEYLSYRRQDVDPTL